MTLTDAQKDALRATYDQVVATFEHEALLLKGRRLTLAYSRAAGHLAGFENAARLLGFDPHTDYQRRHAHQTTVSRIDP